MNDRAVELARVGERLRALRRAAGQTQAQTARSVGISRQYLSEAEVGANVTYEIIDNSNSALFDSTDIDGVAGELTLDFAADAFGSADLTIRATDTSGLIVDTFFTVDVAAVNDAPVISDFDYTQNFDGSFTFSGTVTDVDDDVQGMIVDFGGILASYGVTATVLANGTFSLTQQFPGLQSGYATAQTEDDGGAESNLATVYVYAV